MSESSERKEAEPSGGGPTPVPNAKGDEHGHRNTLREVREDLKFIIGLGTGALVLSVAFIEKIAPTPSYRLLLAVGWVALLISILAGIETIRHSHALSILWGDQLGRTLGILARGPIDKLLLAEILAKFLGREGEAGEMTTDELREKFLREWRPEHVETIYRHLIERFSQDEELKPLVELLSLGQGFGRLSKQISVDGVIKRLRRAIVWTYFLDPIALYSFYTGTLLIAIFAILNLWS
jgi:hypothetical protein